MTVNETRVEASWLVDQSVRLLVNSQFPPVKKIPEEASIREKGQPTYLTLSELFLTETEPARFDYVLFVVAVMGDGELQKPFAYFLGPETIRSHMSVRGDGVAITEIELGVSQEPVKKILSGLYRIKRGFRSTQRILEATQSLVSAVNYKADYQGSTGLAQTILMHLQVLAGHDQVELILGGAIDLPDNAHRFLNYLSEGLRVGDQRDLHMKDGQLSIGRSQEIAKPLRSVSFFTLRLGETGKPKSQHRSILELRRQYALTAGTPGKEENKDAIIAQREKESDLRQRRELTYVYGSQNIKKVPVVLPIMLGVADNLLPGLLTNNTLTKAFNEMIDMMRDGLQYELGFERLPEVRVRAESQLPDGSYIISLDEIPLVVGNAKINKVMVNQSIDSLLALNIPAEDTINPANGNQAAWIDEQHKEAAERAGATTWDSSGYIVLHLSSVLRKNFAEFVTTERVANETKVKAGTSYAAITKVNGGIGRLADLLKMFADEEVPIKEMETICSIYLDLTEKNTPIYEILETLRNHDKIRTMLNVNRWDIETGVESRLVYELDEEIIEMVRNGIVTEGDVELLALEPEPTQEILAAVRNEVKNLPPETPNPIVMTPDWRIRRHVRKLVELEFPHLMVMSRREIVKQPKTIATIRLD